MAVTKQYYTPTQWRIAAFLSWMERLQEAITAYRFKVMSAKALREVAIIEAEKARQVELNKQARLQYPYKGNV